MELSHYEQLPNTEQDRLDEQRMLPCKYFVKGYCYAGSRCRFYHPAPSQIRDAIRVPPLPKDFGAPHTAFEAEIGRGRRFIPRHRYEYLTNQTRPTDCQFDKDDEIIIYCDSNCGYSDNVFDFQNYFEDENRVMGEEGDAPQHVLGVTSTYDNGLVSYNYPEVDNNYSIPTDEFYVDDLNYDMDEEHLPTSSKSQTLFTHINWNEFMLPGKSPPPYTVVPFEETTEKPKRGNGFLDRVRPPPSAVNGANNEDMKKLSAKEEFQLKVKQIALELAAEPVPQVRSLDSFFDNYENLENLPPEMLVRNNESEAPTGTPSENTTEPKYSRLIEPEEGELSDTDELEEFLLEDGSEFSEQSEESL